MIASLTPATPVPSLQRTGMENLFRRLDSDGNGRLTVADRAPDLVKLSPQSVARYAQTAYQPDMLARPAARSAGEAPARYQAVQALAA